MMKNPPGISFAKPGRPTADSLIPFNERTMSLALARGATTHSSSYYYRKDTTKFPASLTASLIKVGGNIIRAIGLFRISPKKRGGPNEDGLHLHRFPTKSAP